MQTLAVIENGTSGAWEMKPLISIALQLVLSLRAFVVLGSAMSVGMQLINTNRSVLFLLLTMTLSSTTWLLLACLIAYCAAGPRVYYIWHNFGER